MCLPSSCVSISPHCERLCCLPCSCLGSLPFHSSARGLSEGGREALSLKAPV